MKSLHLSNYNRPQRHFCQPAFHQIRERFVASNALIARGGLRAGRVLAAALLAFSASCAQGATAAGTYSGLVQAPDNDDVGQIVLQVTRKGAFTCSMTIGTGQYRGSASFDSAGNAQVLVKRSPQRPLYLSLVTDPTGAAQVSGTVTNGAEAYLVRAWRLTFDARTNSAPQAGRYTVVIPGAKNSTYLPEGDGYALVKVTSAGRLQAIGALADATPFSQWSYLSPGGEWPLYVPLYRRNGHLGGWLSVSDGAIAGTLHWSKPPVRLAAYYPQGFKAESEIAGVAYTAPTKTETFLADARLQSTTLGLDIAEQIVVGPNYRLSSQTTNLISFSFNPATGLFFGRAKTKSRSATAALNFTGVLMPSGSGGMFFCDGVSGRISLSRLSSPQVAWRNALMPFQTNFAIVPANPTTRDFVRFVEPRFGESYDVQFGPVPVISMNWRARTISVKMVKPPPVHGTILGLLEHVNGIDGVLPRLPAGNWVLKIEKDLHPFVVTAANQSSPMWVPTEAPFKPWSLLTCSADGNTLAAIADDGSLSVSRDAGATWTVKPVPLPSINTLLSSCEGTTLLVEARRLEDGVCTGPLLSRDLGDTWAAISNPPPLITFRTNAYHVVLQENGDTWLGEIDSTPVCISTNAGATWSELFAPTNFWGSLACSTNLDRIYRLEEAGLELSLDGGVTWSNILSGRWASVSTSADGRTVAAMEPESWATDRGGISLATSTDGGFTWAVPALPQCYWKTVVCSGNGKTLIALPGQVDFFDDDLYLSFDSGSTWTGMRVAESGNLSSAACAADGSVIYLAEHGGPIYVMRRDAGGY